METTRLKFRHHTWGPTHLFYGDLYASREVPCKSTSIPGTRDAYSACCASALERAGDYDFMLLSLPDNDHYSHRHGPEASVESIARADACFAELAEAGGGIDRFLDEHAVILVADHAHSAVHRGLPLADLLDREWDVLRPSDHRPERAQLAVSPTSRAAHVYVLPGEGERADPAQVRRSLEEIEGVDVVCWLEDGEPAVSWKGERGTPAQLPEEEYPAAAARIGAALASPGAGDFVVSLAPGYEAVDWGGISHAGGGSHGSLQREDSLGPLLLCGCGPEGAASRRRWALGDVVGVVLDHFGIG